MECQIWQNIVTPVQKGLTEKSPIYENSLALLSQPVPNQATK